MEGPSAHDQVLTGTGRLDDKSPYAAFTYEKLGLETSAYAFATDQFGTQLNPPAHWYR